MDNTIIRSVVQSDVPLRWSPWVCLAWGPCLWIACPEWHNSHRAGYHTGVSRGNDLLDRNNSTCMVMTNFQLFVSLLYIDVHCLHINVNYNIRQWLKCLRLALENLGFTSSSQSRTRVTVQLCFKSVFQSLGELIRPNKFIVPVRIASAIYFTSIIVLLHWLCTLKT